MLMFPSPNFWCIEKSYGEGYYEILYIDITFNQMQKEISF